MRIYMAGFYQASGASTPNAFASSLADPAHVLESYHYLGPNIRQIRRIRDLGKTIFVDSGAFSMFTQGVEVDLDAYAQWIKDHADISHVASNLDVIGRGQEEATYKNQKYLESLGIKIQPVHHARDHDDWLRRYLDEGYDYIFLGGMVPETTNYLRDWLDHVWERHLCNPDGTAKVKVHGFGLTVLDLMKRYPWFSVDSTSWVMNSRFGSIYLDLKHRDFKVDFSDQSPRQRDDNSWHFNTLKPREKDIVVARLEELDKIRPRNPEIEARVEEATGIKQGYNPEALSKMYGWRDHFNINYFRRMQERTTTKFIREQGGFF